MAVDLALKSTAITVRETSPLIPTNPGLLGAGVLKTVQGYLLAVPAALSATSVIRLVQVPSSAIVTSVKITAGAQGAGKFDIGVYRTNADGGAAVSAEFFTRDLDAASAVIDQECVMKATSLNTLAKRSQPLWQALGMSVDPCTMLDICATVHTTDVTTGTTGIGAVVQYT